MAKPTKDLVQEWDRKLAESGFKEIEDRDSPREMLKSWHSTMFIHRYDQERFTARQKYFELATHFLHRHRFDSTLEQQIWFLHAEGRSLREIAAETGKTSKDGALKVVRKLQKAMRDENG